MIFRYLNHLWTEMSSTGRKTFPWDLTRGAVEGTLIAWQSTFALLVAIQYFDTSVIQKSIIAGAFPMGMVLSLFYASWSPAFGRNTLAGAIPSFATIIGLLWAAKAQDATSFTTGIAIAGIFSQLSIPILIGIYRHNYRDSVRGQVYGITVLILSATTLLCNFTGGIWLDHSITNFRPFLIGLACLYLLGGFSILKMPAYQEKELVRLNPLSWLHSVWQYPLFGYILLIWFIFGLATLALSPQRFEYLSQAQYGFSLSPLGIALVLGVATEAVRLVTIPLLARLFDRINFIWLRMMLNILLVCYLILFYHTRSLPLVVIGSCCLGVMFAGGSIAWNLWVTKFASPEDTAKFMAVHTFLTGVRGTVGPYLGYLCVERYGLSTTSWIALGMVILSILMLFPVRNLKTRQI